MMLKEPLRNIIISQRSELQHFEKGVTREKRIEIDLKLPLAIVISGVRRCGKSTLLRQLMSEVKTSYYCNFEDPRLTKFDVEDFQKLNEVFEEEYDKRDYYFFDEIQNIEKWELFVRLLLDRKKYVVLTGSNASLLSKELGTRLTGRHLRYELFPFSYAEFLKFNNKKQSSNSFEEYLQKGGFPEYLRFERADILQELFRDIIERDIIVRHKIRNEKTLKELGLYLLTNVTSEFSYNKLKKLFALGSPNSVIAFISHFEDSYLLFSVSRFDYSLKKQLISHKKVYSIDNGLINVNSASYSADRGKLLENVVFLHLRKKHREVYYFQESHECDFLVKQGPKITQAIQVCHILTEENKQREITGLSEAMTKFKLDSGIILTSDQHDALRVNNKKITVLPVHEWLLKEP